ncbi:restriction endonuclease subunit S [Burkholderia pseudomallei]|uniref:restriction endonuclease subunit S n=2 Tax=Burkholderia pseudomallei TaxID=28450 RepID=UPI000976EECC|nr:restriction endonuclease subunit S [Burkholderia pseudomallei]CAJ3240698.1 restriction modification system DNA specificity domain-containing protein [Burkholderia pseudomallei]CAJ3246878.1 restriction modification system DNA specificity domain-containing protein [Burkholderia pseudomallei]CAJ3254851.1 restriction modification system DNA specificity domain-containing protein [Burkholderia pseudomallei]CAJ3343704.1 restriction modification system DNA specificity domain-containing protein [Burk
MTPGYKQTDAGVIPDDWDVKQLGELSSVSAGGTPSRSNANYWGGDIPWITTTEIDFRLITESEQFITSIGLKNSAAKLMPAGALLMALYGQGKTRGKVGVLGFEAATNQACAAIILKEGYSREYAFHYLASRYDEIRKLSNTGNQENLNGALVRSIPVLLPPLSEQSAIATALSDVDALLSSLDALIAKKRDIKQAAMQQLLTGKTRLPGFAGEWAVTRLGDHATLIRNGVYSRAELSIDGSVKYLHYGDIHTSGAVHLNPSEAIMPFLGADKAVRLGRLVSGDLVFVDATEDLAGVGKSVEVVGAEGTEVVAGLHTIAVRFDKRILADGFKAYLQFIPAFGAHLRSLAAGTKVLSTNRSHIASAEIALPSIAEQAAIAQVLSDMDAELAALEARRDKTRLLKQGMMQELLTGKTRLV